jgi:hypothetical protein
MEQILSLVNGCFGLGVGGWDSESDRLDYMRHAIAKMVELGLLPKPLYTHDCESCLYLGQYEDKDLYYCSGGFTNTVIARYGNDGPEYMSGMIFAINGHNPNLVEAYKRANLLGLDMREYTEAKVTPATFAEVSYRKDS